MLARADAVGFVEASIPGLSRIANLDMSEVEDGIAILESPDPYSKDKTDGRRITSVPGGWILINYESYRNRKDGEARREWMRDYMRRYRSNGKPKPVNDLSTHVNNGKPDVNFNAYGKPQAEAEAEAEATNKKKKEPEEGAVAPVFLEFANHLKTPRVMAKWQVWMTHRRAHKKPKSWLLLFNEQIEWLTKFDEPTAFEILSASIRNGWQGLFEPTSTNGRKTSIATNPRLTGVSRNPINNYAEAAKRKMAGQMASPGNGAPSEVKGA